MACDLCLVVEAAIDEAGAVDGPGLWIRRRSTGVDRGVPVVCAATLNFLVVAASLERIRQLAVVGEAGSSC